MLHYDYYYHCALCEVFPLFCEIVSKCFAYILNEIIYFFCFFHLSFQMHLTFIIKIVQVAGVFIIYVVIETQKEMMNISVIDKLRYVPHCITQFALLDFNIKIMIK